ncbi:MAG: hypothetical protein RI932_887, partial [Pseudomonadota bacterium]
MPCHNDVVISLQNGETSDATQKIKKNKNNQFFK